MEGLILAAERGRGGEIYFVSDGEPRDFREFIEALLKTRGVDGGNKKVPLSLAKAIANLTDPIWSAFRTKNPPPIPKTLIYIMAQKLTVHDAKARAELGYRGSVTFEEGLAEMDGGA